MLSSSSCLSSSMWVASCFASAAGLENSARQRRHCRPDKKYTEVQENAFVSINKVHTKYIVARKKDRTLQMYIKDNDSSTPMTRTCRGYLKKIKLRTYLNKALHVLLKKQMLHITRWNLNKRTLHAFELLSMRYKQQTRNNAKLTKW